MKRTLTILSVALAALMMTSCVESSKKYKELVAQKEALAIENKTMENEYNTALGIINDVENNLQAIRDAEGLMRITNEGDSQREQIVSELLQIKDVMAMNRARLDSLNEALDKSAKDNRYLRNTIKKLQAQIAEKDAMIAQLQEQIAQKDTQISNLHGQVNNLNKDLNAANQRYEEQMAIIEEQVNEMNAVYYIGMKKKDLKKNGILTAKFVLKKEVPVQLFTKADKRNLNEITFDTKKVKVLSSHPESSYTIAQNDNKTTLNITDPEMFWSVTKYLVVATK